MDVIYRYDPFAPITSRAIPNAEAALKSLIDGNDRFIRLVSQMQERTMGSHSGEPIVVPISPMAMGLPLYPGAMPVQAPFAVVLGCSDARVPTEAVFDKSFNDLFVLRIAGNVLGSECLGSLHYAVRNLKESLKLIVVLGHSKCGAVTAAVDTHLSPDAYVSIACTFPLRSLIDQIQVAVRGATFALEKYAGCSLPDQTLYRSLLVGITAYVNAAVSAFELQRELGAGTDDCPQVVFGVYDFETLRVQGSPSAAETSKRLQPAPRTAEDLANYAALVVEEFLAQEQSDREPGYMLTLRG
jgi:carbonic anhydrase